MKVQINEEDIVVVANESKIQLISNFLQIYPPKFLRIIAEIAKKGKYHLLTDILHNICLYKLQDEKPIKETFEDFLKRIKENYSKCDDYISVEEYYSQINHDENMKEDDDIKDDDLEIKIIRLNCPKYYEDELLLDSILPETKIDSPKSLSRSASPVVPIAPISELEDSCNTIDVDVDSDTLSSGCDQISSKQNQSEYINFSSVLQETDLNNSSILQGTKIEDDFFHKDNLPYDLRMKLKMIKYIKKHAQVGVPEEELFEHTTDERDEIFFFKTIIPNHSAMYKKKNFKTTLVIFIPYVHILGIVEDILRFLPIHFYYILTAGNVNKLKTIFEVDVKLTIDKLKVYTDHVETKSYSKVYRLFYTKCMNNILYDNKIRKKITYSYLEDMIINQKLEDQLREEIDNNNKMEYNPEVQLEDESDVLLREFEANIEELKDDIILDLSQSPKVMKEEMDEGKLKDDEEEEKKWKLRGEEARREKEMREQQLKAEESKRQDEFCKKIHFIYRELYQKMRLYYKDDIELLKLQEKRLMRAERFGLRFERVNTLVLNLELSTALNYNSSENLVEDIDHSEENGYDSKPKTEEELAAISDEVDAYVIERERILAKRI